MNQKEFNFLNMTDRTLAFMNENKPKWGDEPEINESIRLITRERTDAGTKGTLQSGLSGKGYTEAKNNSFDNYVGKTYKLCRKISAFAKKKGLTALLPLVDISLTSLSRGPEKDVVNRCKAVTELATKHLGELTNFKVTQAEIDGINQQISEYQNHVDNRSIANIGKTSSGDDVEFHISNLRHQLDVLDDLVEGLIEDETFIRDYKTARIIVDYGKGKTLKNKERVQ